MPAKELTAELDYISPELRGLATPIEGVSVDPANVRMHPVDNLEAIKGSLRRFGQQKPIITNSSNVIIAGNGTFTAAKELGWTHIAVVKTDLAGAEATAFAIADNRTAELAVWDRDALAQQIQALNGEDALDGVGFTPDEIAELIAEAQGEPVIPDNAEGKEYGEGAADDIKTVTCPACGAEVPV